MERALVPPRPSGGGGGGGCLTHWVLESEAGRQTPELWQWHTEKKMTWTQICTESSNEYPTLFASCHQQVALWRLISISVSTHIWLDWDHHDKCDLWPSGNAACLSYSHQLCGEKTKSRKLSPGGQGHTLKETEDPENITFFTRPGAAAKIQEFSCLGHAKRRLTLRQKNNIRYL